MEGLFVSTKVLEYLYSKLISYHNGHTLHLLGDIMIINIQKVAENSPTRDSEISLVVLKHRT